MTTSEAVHRDLKKGMEGADVSHLQRSLATRTKELGLEPPTVDGEIGTETLTVGHEVARQLGVSPGKADRISEYVQTLIRDPRKRNKTQVARAAKIAKAKKARPLRLKAYDVAVGLIGVMEQGGNNSGPMVSKIIKANGGTGPEAWCGDFQAYNYRLAGSKAVQRLWASVFFLGTLAGITKTTKPQTGDLVRFTFDHVGMFVKDNGNGTITTIEGNTGSSGAVSDSSTGGDGVYKKIRAKSLVQDYLHVTR